MPFSADLVDEFLHQANLSKLLKDYKPSMLSQIGTNGTTTKKQKASKKKATNLRPQDVLCGRGSNINKHPGNMLMRYAIFQNQKQYFELEKGLKKISADAIIGLLESWDMRFLEANPDVPAKFRVCSYERANEKIMQGLRQKIFKNRKHVNPIKESPIQKSRETNSKGVTRGPSKTKAAPHKAAKKTKAAKPTGPKKSRRVAPTKVTPDKKKQQKQQPKSKTSTTTASSTEGTDKSPRSVTTVTPILVKGTFQQPIVAPVLCLATFLRSKLEKKE